jgi:hemerythrin-like metal-binding protein
LKWKEEYATGDAEIDRQHKTLFAFVEEFRDVLEKGCSSETYKEALAFLKIYSEAHFGFEEECMLAHKCPATCKNKKEHSLFLNVVKKETEYFEAHGFSTEKALRLMDIIDNWLDSHICRVDVQLKDCMD